MDRDRGPDLVAADEERQGDPQSILSLTALPGSITLEGVVVWRPKGKAAALDLDIGVEDLEPRALAPTGMDVLIRALAYATLAYWIRTYLDGLTDWDSILTRRIGGWIARVEVEGRQINAKGKSLEGICWCPIDTREQALDLIEFLGKLGASGDLKVAYLHGEAQLIRDPFSKKIASWNAMEESFGVHAKDGIRRAFHAGLDLTVVERISEQYVHSTTLPPVRTLIGKQSQADDDFNSNP